MNNPYRPLIVPLEYSDDWTEYRRLRWRLIVLALMAIVCAALLCILSPALTMLTVAAVLWPLFQLQQRLQNYPCPRCRQSFFIHRGRWRVSYTTHLECAHCRWPIWYSCNDQERNRWQQELLAKNQLYCLECNAPIAEESEQCEQCGWSYRDETNDENIEQ